MLLGDRVVAVQTSVALVYNSQLLVYHYHVPTRIAASQSAGESHSAACVSLLNVAPCGFFFQRVFVQTEGVEAQIVTSGLYVLAGIMYVYRFPACSSVRLGSVVLIVFVLVHAVPNTRRIIQMSFGLSASSRTYLPTYLPFFY